MEVDKLQAAKEKILVQEAVKKLNEQIDNDASMSPEDKLTLKAVVLLTSTADLRKLAIDKPNSNNKQRLWLRVGENPRIALINRVPFEQGGIENVKDMTLSEVLSYIEERDISQNAHDKDDDLELQKEFLRQGDGLIASHFFGKH